MDAKRTYTPTEFAALFGKEKSWTYRQLYAGKIEAITDFGRIQIAASQIERVESKSGSYVGKKKPRSKPAVEALPQRGLSNSTEGGAKWASAVSARRKIVAGNSDGKKSAVERRNAMKRETKK